MTWRICHSVNLLSILSLNFSLKSPKSTDVRTPTQPTSSMRINSDEKQCELNFHFTFSLVTLRLILPVLLCIGCCYADSILEFTFLNYYSHSYRCYCYYYYNLNFISLSCGWCMCFVLLCFVFRRGWSRHWHFYAYKLVMCALRVNSKSGFVFRAACLLITHAVLCDFDFFLFHHGCAHFYCFNNATPLPP